MRKWALSVKENCTAAIAPVDFQLPVLYEDHYLLILNKRSGIPSLPLHPDENKTAVNFALRYQPIIANIGKKGLEPGLLHRLDTETSGILTFAKDQKTFEYLTSIWKTLKVRKFYRALVSPKNISNQHVQSSEFFQKFPTTLSFPIAHSRKSAKRMIALQGRITPNQLKGIRGKPLVAVTHLITYHSITHFSQELDSSETFLNDIEIEIETGVRHQIRCHLSAMNWPILGDKVYHGHPSSRLWLHAWKIILPPLAGQSKITIEAPLPEGWPNLSEINASFHT